MQNFDKIFILHKYNIFNFYMDRSNLMDRYMRLKEAQS